MKKRIEYKEVERMASGRWVEIMDCFGIKVPKFKGINSVNHPCPICGGKDRAHWRKTGARISLHCRGCADIKMKSPESVLMEVFNWDFRALVSELARFLHVYPSSYEFNPDHDEPAEAVPKRHRQDHKKSAAFFNSADYAESPFIFGMKYPGKVAMINGNPCLPIENKKGQVINAACIAGDSIEYLAGGVSFCAYHVIKGSDTVVYFLEIGEAIKWHHLTGCTCRVLFDFDAVDWLKKKIEFGEINTILPDWCYYEMLIDGYENLGMYSYSQFAKDLLTGELMKNKACITEVLANEFINCAINNGNSEDELKSLHRDLIAKHGEEVVKRALVRLKGYIK